MFLSLMSLWASPALRWLSIAGAILLVMAAIHTRATLNERAACKARNAAAIAQEIRRQQKASLKVLEVAEARAADAETENQLTQERLNDFVRNLQTADDTESAPCALSEHDARRLRDILTSGRH